MTFEPPVTSGHEWPPSGDRSVAATHRLSHHQLWRPQAQAPLQTRPLFNIDVCLTAGGQTCSPIKVILTGQFINGASCQRVLGLVVSVRPTEHLPVWENGNSFGHLFHCSASQFKSIHGPPAPPNTALCQALLINLHRICTRTEYLSHQLTNPQVNLATPLSHYH